MQVAPKCPGTEVREEYKRGFGADADRRLHPENDPKRRRHGDCEKPKVPAVARARTGIFFRCGSEI